MWALVLNFVMIPVWIAALFVVSAEWGGEVSGSVSFGDLRIGDCVQNPETTVDDDGNATVETIDRIVCEDPHWGQVYFVTELDDGPFPGNDEVWVMSEEACYSDQAVNEVRPSSWEDVWPLVLYPTRDSWSRADRDVICILTRLDEEPFTGSWLRADSAGAP